MVLGLAIAVAGALASAVVASQMDDGSRLVAAIEDAPMTHVADIEAADGAAKRGVYLQVTDTGHLCVWEAPSATSRQRGGGCNTLDDPLNGEALSVTLSYDGGPALSDVKSASLFGLTAADVAQARVLMTDGSTREIQLRPARVAAGDFNAFGFRLRRADLRKGLGPVAVLALAADGTEVGRAPTGFGG
jgi:hypothetical protein